MGVTSSLFYIVSVTIELSGPQVKACHGLAVLSASLTKLLDGKTMEGAKIEYTIGSLAICSLSLHSSRHQAKVCAIFLKNGWFNELDLADERTAASCCVFIDMKSFKNGETRLWVILLTRIQTCCCNR